MDDRRKTEEKAMQAIMARVAKLAEMAEPDDLLRLAEAFAWAHSPAQHHGANSGS